MKMRPRIYYTKEQKAMMWDRWQKGESLSSIARLFDRYHSSIERIIRKHGGIRPPERRRSARALTLPEREEISRGIATGSSIRSIEASLNRAPSTISREIKRNGDGQFYLSRETYHVFNTCNAWTAKALREAGCPITPATNLRIKTLMNNVAKFDTVIQTRP